MAGLDPALLEEVRDALDGAREVIGRMPRAQAGTIAVLRLHAAVESLAALCEDQERRLGWGAYAQGLKDGAGERASAPPPGGSSYAPTIRRALDEIDGRLARVAAEGRDDALRTEAVTVCHWLSRRALQRANGPGHSLALRDALSRLHREFDECYRTGHCDDVAEWVRLAAEARVAFEREGDAVGAPGAVVEPPASGAPSAPVSRETCCEDLGTDPCGEPATGTAFDREHGSYYPACDKHRREPVTEVPAPPGHHLPFRLVEDESLPPNTVVVRGAEGVVEHRFRLVAGKGEVRYWFEEAP